MKDCRFNTKTEAGPKLDRSWTEAVELLFPSQVIFLVSGRSEMGNARLDSYSYWCVCRLVNPVARFWRCSTLTEYCKRQKARLRIVVHTTVPLCPIKKSRTI